MVRVNARLLLAGNMRRVGGLRSTEFSLVTHADSSRGD